MKKIVYLKVLFLLIYTVSCFAENTLLSDPKATAETRALYKNLHIISSKGILFGHQESLAYGVGWREHEFDSDVYKVTGKFPAVFGWDLGHLC